MSRDIREPTLEEIADQTSESPFLCAANQAALASHLLTLIESSDEHCHRLDGIDYVLSNLGERLTALEQQSRAYAEDGALAAGRGAGDDIDWKMTADEWRERHDEKHRLACRMASRATSFEAERDTARAALRKIVEMTGDGWFIDNARRIATDALAGGEANEGSGE